MIQRALLRQCRTAAPAVRASPRTYLFRPQFQPNTARLSPVSRHTPCSRWYATEPEVKKEGEVEVEDLTKKELESKTKEIVDLKDKYLRSVADFRNLQERTKREVQQAKDYAIQKFAKDLVESIDNLDRALEMVPQEKLAAKDTDESVKDLVNLFDGLKMTETILMQTLKRHGLERFDPSLEGEKFNPNEHEATFMTPMQGKEDNTVFHTQQKGFKLNGRILRAAKVGVVKNS